MFQIDLKCSAAVLGSELAVYDNITWTKGEVLGKGAYGIVSVAIQTNKVTLKPVGLSVIKTAVC